MIQIFIKYHNKSIPLLINCKDTIETLKYKLRLPQVALYHNGYLNNNYTIEHYGIKNNDTIEIVGKLGGGLPIIDPSGTTISNIREGIQWVVTNIQKISKNAHEFVMSKMTFAHMIAEKFRKIAAFVKMMITIAKFFPIITLFLMILAALGRPMEFMLMIVALFIVTILYVAYSVLNLPPFIYIVAGIWFIIFDIIPFLIYCAVFGALFVLITLICVLLTIINTIFWGSLKNLVLCQSSPGSWYKTPNYQLGNKYERNFMCNKPCFSRYMPDPTGTMCVTTPKGFPPYCPQAEIMRIYHHKKSDRRHMYKVFNDKSNVKYLSKPPEERETMLKEYYLNKRAYKDSCASKMKEYDSMCLHICASADALRNNKHLSDKEADRLKEVCAQVYCTSSVNYPFCAKISELKEKDDNAIIKQVIKVLIIFIVFCFILIYVFQNIYSKLQKN